MRYAYSYELAAAPEGGFSITFPDVPEAITQAETKEAAAHQAQDALVSALSFYVDEGQALPRPSAPHGRSVAMLPVLVAAKLALHDAMLAERISNTDLGRRLGLSEKAVRRLRDPLHRSHVELVEAALRCLGKRAEVRVLDAA